jgi:hypothetical protein
MQRISSWLRDKHLHLPAMIGLVIGHAAFLTTFVWLFG